MFEGQFCFGRGTHQQCLFGLSPLCGFVWIDVLFVLGTIASLLFCFDCMCLVMFPTCSFDNGDLLLVLFYVLNMSLFYGLRFICI